MSEDKTANGGGSDVAETIRKGIFNNIYYII
jgi:hypothetical protein